MLKANINEIAVIVWKNMKLDFDAVLDEVIYYISILEEDQAAAEQIINRCVNDAETIKTNILTNMVRQKNLRNVIVDGILLSDLEYSIKFFNLDLYVVINQCLHNRLPTYKNTIYRFINKQLVLAFPDEIIEKILKKISAQLKTWLIQESKKRLASKNNVIFYKKEK